MMKALAAILLFVALSGCCGSTSREAAYHDGVKQYALESGMLDEYEKYVDADPKLKDATKKIRKDTSKGLRALIAEEGKALDK
jgi:hypothetical protein